MEPTAKRSRLTKNAESDAKRVEASIGDLSDELLAHIFSYLYMEDAWRCRPVCKAWLKVIQVSSFLHLGSPRFGFDVPSHLSDLAVLLRSSSAAVQLSDVDLSLGTDGLSQADAFGLWGNALGVLSAIASQHAGRGPKDVSLCFALSVSEGVREETSECVVPMAALASAAESFVVAPLAALKPPSRHGSDAPAALEELSLDVKLRAPQEIQQRLLKGIADNTLRSALAPFSNLRSLELPTGWLLFGRAQAAVLAECCPRLAKLTMTASEAAAVASLAPLPLEELMLSGHPFDIDIGGSLTALAAGAAGRTLKHFSGSRNEINSNDLRAVAIFPELRDFKNFQVNDDVSREDVAALGAAPKLRELVVFFEGNEDATAFVAGLADAVRASRTLEELSVYRTAPEGTDPAALADFVGASAGVLREFRYRLDRALTAPEVAALAACTGLSGAVDCVICRSADLLALEGLRGTSHHFRVQMQTDDPLLCSAAQGVLSTWLNARGEPIATVSLAAGDDDDDDD
eukprot:tig00021621_g22980.t1